VIIVTNSMVNDRYFFTDSLYGLIMVVILLDMLL